MHSRYKANMGREKAKPGVPRAVIGFKDYAGNRWEFVGALPIAAVDTIRALAVSNGVHHSLKMGQDDGLDGAFWGQQEQSK